jgi:hypothetical protein
VRKSQITRIPGDAPPTDQTWMDLNRKASVEVSSEDSDYSIESALLLEEKKGWRAATPGTQTIRLIFDEPQKLKRIFLVFEDTENTRTQECIVRWSPEIDGSFQEIIRQQWNFSSPDSVRETEDYRVELAAVKVLELMIVPYKSGRQVHASLMCLRLA